MEDFMSRRRATSHLCAFFSVVGGLCLLFWLWADGDISQAERRPLQTLPELSIERVLSGAYMEDWERYMQDQFPAREYFRGLKALTQIHILGKEDSNGIYLEDGSAIKMETVTRLDASQYVADKINTLVATHFPNARSFASIIPDKYAVAKKTGRPTMDAPAVLEVFQENLTGVQYVSIWEDLSLGDYYLTDAHWKQENLGAVREKLSKAMGIALPPLESYETERLQGFAGVYLGQSALPMEKDSLRYLHNDTIDSARVHNVEDPAAVLSVYAPEKFEGTDGYDVFLHGAKAVLTLENTRANSDKHLVLFRDSFGSALAPLLLNAYKSITLIDLRYVSSEHIAQFLPPQVDDVLFLYSLPILNNGRLLR